MRRGVLAAIICLAQVGAGCTGQSASVQTTPSEGGGPSITSSPVPTVTVRVTKPHDIRLKLVGSHIAVSGDNPSAGLWAASLTRDSGAAVCSQPKPSGFHYAFSDLSMTGVTASITCDGDGSDHTVRIIFVSESG